MNICKRRRKKQDEMLWIKQYTSRSNIKFQHIGPRIHQMLKLSVARVYVKSIHEIVGVDFSNYTWTIIIGGVKVMQSLNQNFYFYHTKATAIHFVCLKMTLFPDKWGQTTYPHYLICQLQQSFIFLASCNWWLFLPNSLYLI